MWLKQEGRDPGSSAHGFHTPSLLSMVERGVALPSIGTLVAISEVLKVPMSSLFDSSRPHQFRNVGKEVARTLWINVYGRRHM